MGMEAKKPSQPLAAETKDGPSTVKRAPAPASRPLPKTAAKAKVTSKPKTVSKVPRKPRPKPAAKPVVAKTNESPLEAKDKSTEAPDDATSAATAAKKPRTTFMTAFAGLVSSMRKNLKEHAAARAEAEERRKDEHATRESQKQAKNEKPNIKAPVGKSMIDVFDSEASLDRAVLDTLKGKDYFAKIFHRRSRHTSALDNIVARINSVPRFRPTPEKGLTTEQVSQRVAEGLTNKVAGSYTRSVWEIISDNCFTFFNIILLIIAVALMVSGYYSNPVYYFDLSFAVVMIANVAISITQEIRSKHAVDRLRLVTAPSAEVIRDGKTIRIPTDELVIDDIVLLESGVQISADGAIIKGTLEVNESFLTGESLPIKKTVGDIVYAGSFVVSGAATAKVEKVAEANWAINLQARAKKFQKPKSELLRSLHSITRVISLLVIPVGISLFFVNFFNSGGVSGVDRIFPAIGQTAGAIVGMVPAGMFLLTSVALAVGIIRLSRKKTLVQDLYCFEMLARTNVLCLDKTGTLTDGSMEVNEVVILDKTVNINVVMGSFLNSFKEFNQTSLALASRYTLNTVLTPVNTISFSSSRKFSAVSFKERGTYVLGAPEFVYKAADRNLMGVIEDRQKKGYRVVMLAHSDSYISPDGSLEGVVAPLALFILVDHIRPEAYRTIKWFQDNGVETKIISGDNPLTAAEIARTCGVENTDRCVSLEGLSLAEVASVADKYTVFGRVSPEQKAALVKSLRMRGKVVGMTGDGVNDILAMKQADCSVAMASGADAAKSVAQLVLLDSNFASMPAVVLEGRRVINNIQRSSALFLSKTIFTIVLSLAVIILGFSTIGQASGGVVYPFSPRNLTLMEMVGIGIPSFFLALQPNGQQIKGNFLHNTMETAVPGALAILSVVAATFIMARAGVLGTNALSDATEIDLIISLATLAMTFVSLAMVFYLCRPFNTYRTVLMVSLCALTALIVLVFNPTVIPGFRLFAIDVYRFNEAEVLTMVIFMFAAPVLVSSLFTVFRPRKQTANRDQA